jgi:LysM repeat protein
MIIQLRRASKSLDIIEMRGKGMDRVDSCLRLKLPITCLLALLLSLALFESPAFTLTTSSGRPYHGRLINGIPFPNQFQGYYLRDQERSYATPEVIGTVLDAIDAVREQYPDTCDLFIGDFSRAGGGWINMHRSHQNGRDADLGMYAKGNRALDTFVPMNEENLDVPKTWSFIESLLRSQHVQYLFLDRRIQRLLYDYALSRGADPAYLETLFGKGNFRNGIIHHVPHHYDHMHVRFYAPWSTTAARLGDEDEQKRTVVEMAQQAYLPKKVNYYVKGNEHGIEALAQSFGVNQKDLCLWNQLHLNEVLTPGSCLVYYKRSFEMEPVNLARSLQPDSVPDSPTISLASVNAGTLSDITANLPGARSRERRPALSLASTYTAHRGDTLEKVARRTGMDLKVLCDLNRLNPKAGVRPGQKIRLVSSKSPSDNIHMAKSNAIKSDRALPVADPKASSSSFAPAVYTVEKRVTLSKIAKQQGLDLNALCQVNGLHKNATLKPGQKITLLEPGTSQKKDPAPMINASFKPSSKRSTASASTLQANMKPTRDLKSKASLSSQQKTPRIQKASAKASSDGGKVHPVKTQKKAEEKLKK